MEISHNNTYENMEQKDGSLGQSICSEGMKTWMKNQAWLIPALGAGQRLTDPKSLLTG